MTVYPAPDPAAGTLLPLVPDISGGDEPPRPVPVTADQSCCGCATYAQRLWQGPDGHPLCTLCWLTVNLDSQTAAHGHLAWLPDAPAADLINLQRRALSGLVSDSNLLRINGLWHGTLAVNIGPQNPQSFARLRELIPRSVPFRIRQDLMPGGMRRLAGKQGVLGFTEWVPGFRSIFQSVSLLAARERHEPVCVMTITVATRGDSPEAVTRNLTLLKQALGSWGVCGVTETFGNPVRAWVATLTASSAAGGPCLLYPPLSEALNLMPLTRPASPWDEDGNALFPTPDGKIMPVGLATPKQTKLTTVVAGESGGGK